MQQQQSNQLLPVEREYLIKERANLLDRLAFIDTKLGTRTIDVSGRVLGKQERRATRREGVYRAKSDE